MAGSDDTETFISKLNIGVVRGVNYIAWDNEFKVM